MDFWALQVKEKKPILPWSILTAREKFLKKVINKVPTAEPQVSRNLSGGNNLSAVQYEVGLPYGLYVNLSCVRSHWTSSGLLLQTLL